MSGWQSRVSTIPDYAGWDTSSYRVFWDITCDDGTCSYDRLCSNMNAWQNTGVHSDICAYTYPDRLNDKSCCDDRLVNWCPSVGGAEYLGAGSPAYIIFQHQVPGIKVGLWSNP